jgi:hypothetical protein
LVTPKPMVYAENNAYKQKQFFTWQYVLQFLYCTSNFILSVSLQSTLSRAIVTHTSCLNPPSPFQAILSDADITTVHLFSQMMRINVQ